MKVYVIMEGEYSDIHVCGVTESEEKANRLKSIFPEAWIEEYDTDEFTIPEMSFYTVIINNDGEIFLFKNENSNEYLRSKEEGIVKESYYYRVRLYEKDADSARKKAFYMIAKFMANEN